MDQPPGRAKLRLRNLVHPEVAFHRQVGKGIFTVKDGKFAKNCKRRTTEDSDRIDKICRIEQDFERRLRFVCSLFFSLAILGELGVLGGEIIFPESWRLIYSGLAVRFSPPLFLGEGFADSRLATSSTGGCSI